MKQRSLPALGPATAMLLSKLVGRSGSFGAVLDVATAVSKAEGPVEGPAFPFEPLAMAFVSQGFGRGGADDMTQGAQA